MTNRPSCPLLVPASVTPDAGQPASGLSHLLISRPGFGRDRYLRFNQEYPGDWHLRGKLTIADEHHAVVWFEWLLDGGVDDAMAFFEFTDGLITRITDFWPEPYEPPPGREHLVERW